MSSLSIYPLIDTGCFHNLAVVNYGAMNMKNAGNLFKIMILFPLGLCFLSVSLFPLGLLDHMFYF